MAGIAQTGAEVDFEGVEVGGNRRQDGGACRGRMGGILRVVADAAIEVVHSFGVVGPAGWHNALGIRVEIFAVGCSQRAAVGGLVDVVPQRVAVADGADADAVACCRIEASDGAGGVVEGTVGSLVSGGIGRTVLHHKGIVVAFGHPSDADAGRVGVGAADEWRQAARNCAVGDETHVGGTV